MRRSSNSLTRRAMESKGYGKRRVVRPSKNMVERITERVQKIGKSVKDLKQMTRDRKKWTNWVKISLKSMS